MALEDEIINIEDLDIANEIKIGDYVLLETTDGTKLIDFKDFIIGTDNITFYDKISGGDFLQRADISDLSANVTSNTSILTDISAVYDDINSIQGKLDATSNDLMKFRADISGLSEVELSTHTSGSVGVNASGAGSGTTGDGYGSIYFTKLDFSGNGLETSGSAAGTVNIGSLSEGFSYIAKGSYNIFLITNFSYKKHRVLQGPARLAQLYRDEPTVSLLKGDQIIESRTISTLFDNDISIIRNIRVVAGDKLTLNSGGAVQSGNISITVA